MGVGWGCASSASVPRIGRCWRRCPRPGRSPRATHEHRATMKRPVTVTIAGQRFALRTDTEEAAVQKLAAFVDARVKETQKATRTADTQSVAILVALQIAEELFAA